MLSILFNLLMLAPAQTLAEENPWKLQPFTTDGCTVLPDGTAEAPSKWIHCCHAHDLAYWMGGSFSDRRAADLDFKECISRAGEPTLAFFVYLGVRVSGTAILPTPFRWGYGWTGVRGYWPLTQAEREEVARFKLQMQSTAKDILSSSR